MPERCLIRLGTMTSRPPFDVRTGWAEETIEEIFTFYRLPRQHHKHMKSTNMIERFNEEIKRRTIVLRIFPNEDNCLRLIRSLAVETHENWLETNRYLNMNDLKEMKKADLRQAALASMPGCYSQDLPHTTWAVIATLVTPSLRRPRASIACILFAVPCSCAAKSTCSTLGCPGEIAPRSVKIRD